MKIVGWFNSPNYRIDQLRFANGTILTADQIDGMDKRMYGTAGADSLIGTEGREEMFGYEGNDSLSGAGGNDTLDGGAGNDTLNGGGGNDVYRFTLGSGVDTINDYDTAAGNTDIVEFGTGITAADLELIKENMNLRIKIGGTTDALVIQSWFSGDPHKVEQFRFADGTVLTPSDLNSCGYKVYGTSNNETLDGSGFRDEMYGYEGNDTLNGLGGDDTLVGASGIDYLSGSDGNDTLDGGSENDTLVGGNGSDLLDGGTGNDSLQGGAGNDVYKFSIGYGTDTINENDATVGNIDAVEFGPGITSGNLELVKESSNLRINILGTTDSLVLSSWFLGGNYQVEQLRFADGTVLTNADLDVIGYKVYGTANADSLTGSSARDEIYGYDGNDTLTGLAGNDLLEGASGADTLVGGDGNDTLRGGDGNDTLSGGNSDDILEGGTGNDNLTGGTGSDTYKFSLGGGVDTISEYDTTVGNVDIIEFGVGIASSNLELLKEGTNLRIKILGTTDALVLQSWFSGVNYQVEQLRFADGSVLTPADLDVMGYKIYGTINADTLYGSSAGRDEVYGYEGNDTIYGYGGNDSLFGSAGVDTLDGGDGNDLLDGGADNDNLYAGNGNDLLDGGVGNDTLQGTTGNDVYRFNLGYGTDTISDYDTTVGNIDVIEFGPGITSGNLELVKESTSLRIKILGTTDSVVLQSWFSGPNYQVEQLRFADGTVLTPADLDTIGYKVYGTASTETLYGSSAGRDTMYGYEGNDSLYGYGGDDTLLGAAGVDYLEGGDGNDTLDGGADNDNLYGGNGNDVLYGGLGNDTLQGNNGDDVLNGDDGDDNLYGGAGNDILDGGAGSDYLSGDDGSDIYRFNLGGGFDKIYNYDTNVANIDVVEFGPGISLSGVEFVKEDVSGNSHLRIMVNGTTDSLQIMNWFNGANYRIDQIRFADGTVITPADIENTIGYKVYGSMSNDSLLGSNSKDDMFGYDGNDTLQGYDGNDILGGGNGLDTLLGNAGNDLLDGGSGNDSLQGGMGNDTYKFSLGGGQDTISEYDVTAGNTDTADFNVNPLDLILARNGLNLDISINGTSDSITVQNWYGGTGYQTEVLHAQDGSSLLNSQVDQLIQAMATFCTNNSLSSWGQAVQERPQDVQQVLAQYWTPQP